MARPFLRAATMSSQAVGDEFAVVIGQLRATMMGVGAKDLSALRAVQLVSAKEV
jgi:isopentenyl diphosphate isomerase/L-lactate dehydrogenase-like FMN-dependent dehydrogenase